MLGILSKANHESGWIRGCCHLALARMGQLASGTAPKMGAYAALLFALHPDLGRAYLKQRIRHESSGDYGIDDIPA